MGLLCILFVNCYCISNKRKGVPVDIISVCNKKEMINYSVYIGKYGSL